MLDYLDITNEKLETFARSCGLLVDSAIGPAWDFPSNESLRKFQYLCAVHAMEKYTQIKIDQINNLFSTPMEK